MRSLLIWKDDQGSMEDKVKGKQQSPQSHLPWRMCFSGPDGIHSSRLRRRGFLKRPRPLRIDLHLEPRRPQHPDEV